MWPILHHGSHFIYAPDEVGISVVSKFPDGVKRIRGARCTVARPKSGLAVFGNVVFACFVFAALAGFKKYGHEASCAVQTFMLDWATMNRGFGTLSRFVSISGMMVVRQFVSNVLPFTSPVFAYLIAKSLPPDQEYLGTVYLLLCSMPAGALIPCLDYLFSPWRSTASHPDCHFRATRFVSGVTDYLPFSFWVRPYFMQPAFDLVNKDCQDSASAAAAAVCAGHFMIWAGPATTMHQRRFVPDWITCIFIQPLGLLEDVAVVLATWAGESQVTEIKAEIGLYVFMLVMNLINWMSEKSSCRCALQHVLVAAITAARMYVVIQNLENMPALVETTPSPLSVTTTLAPGTCETMHSNVAGMAHVVVTVSVVAVASRVVARALTYCVPEPKEDTTNEDYY